MTTEELRRLRDDTNKVIPIVKAKRVSGAVNWFDLRCMEARWVVNTYGMEWSEVLIQEASPDAIEFQMAVSEELDNRGWHGVAVRTEW